MIITAAYGLTNTTASAALTRCPIVPPKIGMSARSLPSRKSRPGII